MAKSQLRTQFPRSTANPAKEAFSKLRREMVEKAIVARGVRSELVLSAMRSVPREAFLPHQLREFAYTDSPLPIEEGQTISQPYIVAFMTEAAAKRCSRSAPGRGTRRLSSLRSPATCTRSNASPAGREGSVDTR
jgi:Protein-L-isoaspartate(D-aspartate) O-methyltransferase (PCMT)